MSKKNSTTIVRFINREHANSVMEKQSEIRNFDFSSLFQTEEKIKLYANPNLNYELKGLFRAMRAMKKDGLLAFYGSSQKGIYYQTQQKGFKTYVWSEVDLHKFLCEGDLKKYF